MYLSIANGLACVLYGLVAVLMAQAVIRRATPGPGAFAAGLSGVVLHGVGLAISIMLSPSLPGHAESLSVSGLALMVVTLMLRGDRVVVLQVVLSALAGLAAAGALASPAGLHLETSGDRLSPWLVVHLALIFVAVAGFVLEFFVGLVQVIVRRRLKSKALVGLARLPSLETLDIIQYRALVTGLVALTLGILAGGMFASGILPHQEWLLDPKVAFTLVVWFWYALSFGLRLYAGWHGRWSMAFSALGFVGLVFSLVGLDFVTRGFHAYGG